MERFKVAAGIAIVVLALILSSFYKEPEVPSANDRAKQFHAQEEYYRVLELYGDAEGAQAIYDFIMEGA